MVHHVARSLFVLTFFASVVLAGAASRSVMEIRPKSFDFGDVLHGTTVNATARIVNTTDKPLVIGKIKTSCGCTSANAAVKEIGPRGEAKIEVSFNADGLTPGKKTQTVFLYTDDAEVLPAKMRIFARVFQEVSVQPKGLVARFPTFREKVSFPLTITNRWNRRAIVEAEEARGAVSAVALTPRRVEIEPGDQRPCSIELTLSKHDSGPFYRGVVILKTNHPKEDRVSLNAFIRVDDSPVPKKR